MRIAQPPGPPREPQGRPCQWDSVTDEAGTKRHLTRHAYREGPLLVNYDDVVCGDGPMLPSCFAVAGAAGSAEPHRIHLGNIDCKFYNSGRFPDF